MKFIQIYDENTWACFWFKEVINGISNYLNKIAPQVNSGIDLIKRWLKEGAFQTLSLLERKYLEKII